MKYQVHKGAHSVYSLYFPLVCVTKYRKNVFEPIIATRLKQLVYPISTAYEVTSVEQELDQDHSHMLFSCSPTLNLPKYIRILTSSTSTSFRQAFPQMHQQLWGKAFWSPSYLLAITGQVKLEVIRKYVENQGRP